MGTREPGDQETRETREPGDQGNQEIQGNDTGKHRKERMRSDAIKKGNERAPHRALLKAVGVTDADMDKPFVAVVNSYVDIVPGLSLIHI